MGNESSKKKAPTLPFSLKSGPSNSLVQRHLENAQKSRVLQLKGSSLKSVPPQIEEVTNILRNLDLSQNKIRELPLYIANFSVLKQLHLSQNLLTELPDEIGCIKTLELLDVSHNQLISLPPTLVGCFVLKNLNVSHNKISIFPVVVTQLPEIEIIDLSHNLIEVIPEEVKDLHVAELNLNANRLNTIHPNISMCKRLKVFRVDENCLHKNQFSKKILEDSQILLITYAGNLFQDRDFQDLAGYETYQERFTATKRKGV